MNQSNDNQPADQSALPDTACSTKSIEGLYAVVDDEGLIDYTTIRSLELEAVNEWLETQDALNALFDEKPKTWEEYKSEGYRVEKVNVVPSS